MKTIALLCVQTNPSSAKLLENRMGLLRFNTIANVPVHYDRYHADSGFGYGTRGKPFRPQASATFIRTLDQCFGELFQICPFGIAEVITSAGAFVDKPGFHGLGRAFDLDGIFWPDQDLVAIEYPSKPFLYLAIESILRRHFGTVLAYNYNADHRDHFHLDNGSAVRFDRMSKSRVEYLQAAMTFVHGDAVEVDGVWGPSTDKALRRTLNDLGLSGGLSSKTTWLKFLEDTSKLAFAMST